MINAWIAAALAAALGAAHALADDEEPPAEAPASAPVLALDAPPSSPLTQTAEVYAAFHQDVNRAGLRELRSGHDLDAVMDSLAAYYQGDRLVDAQIAYAALVAAQHPEFIDAVRAVADYYGMETARAALMHDPIFVTGFMGADLAQDSVVGAIEEDVAHMRQVGERYRQESYSLQRQAWAMRRERDRRERNEALNTAHTRLQARFRRSGEEAEGEPRLRRSGRMGSAVSMFAERPANLPDLPELSVSVGERQITPDERRVGRFLAVAALQSIESGDMSALDTLLSEPAVERCIEWSRLMLQQCIAAGSFRYEDSFCIAAHALNDVAQCLSTAQRQRRNLDHITVSN
ncbi:hypothetical protein F1654_01220 [Alkalicaulis satelles]|uniref:DUF2059 domain-containing protein n=1 Tax=Alkalicaulis satelles TaxID=2609175 RepID=A0A5M6ZIJ5_9PROT|nr:hypothetical protein [Alkalicaulis satelles]KAA5804656.1 hypothetical protein F1654_01220 [Alkalicaulis satelles]